MQIYSKSNRSLIYSRAGNFWGLPRVARAKRERNGGFTVLEFTIVMVIATILTTALVVQNQSWNDSLQVSSQAYDLTLTLRQAQFYSLGVKEYQPGATDDDKFQVGYGVRIDSESPNQYIFFVDKLSGGAHNFKLDSGETIQTISLKSGVTIEKVCGIRSGSETCNPTASLSKIDISFLRPDPKANIKFMKSGSNNSSNDASGFSAPATIYLKSPKGVRVKIKIDSNGQISQTPA